MTNTRNHQPRNREDLEIADLIKEAKRSYETAHAWGLRYEALGRSAVIADGLGRSLQVARPDLVAHVNWAGSVVLRPSETRRLSWAGHYMGAETPPEPVSDPWGWL